MEKDLIQPSTRFWEMFFKVFEGLPRQDPGNLACAMKAIDLCCDLPSTPAVLDLGCGVGGQTLYLAELLQDTFITAMDRHLPSIENCRRW